MIHCVPGIADALRNHFLLWEPTPSTAPLLVFASVSGWPSQVRRVQNELWLESKETGVLSPSFVNCGISGYLFFSAMV